MPFDVETIPQTKRYRNVRCDGCDVALKLAVPCEVDGAWPCLQPEDGLEVHLVGGYGMAIDSIDMTEDQLTLVFCKDCTSKLCDQFPGFQRIVRST